MDGCVLLMRITTAHPVNTRCTAAYCSLVICCLELPAWSLSPANGLGVPSTSSATTPLDAQKSTASVSTLLTEFETKLFERNYKGEDDATRLKRLEEFVFGQTQDGTVQSRLVFLQNAIMANELTANDVNPTNKPATAKPPPAAPGNNQSADTKQAFDYSNYPRVTDLERQLLGKTYPGDALEGRLGRLETKAFGKPSASSDLAQRTDLLDQYAQRHDIYNERSASKQLPASPPTLTDMNAAPPPENPFANASAITGVEDRVSTMEKAVFNHVYENRSLEARVEKLEKKLLPYEHALAQKPIDNRINHLWTILSVANYVKSAPIIASSQGGGAINTQPPRNQNADDDDDTGEPSTISRHPWLKNLAKSLGGTNGLSGPPGDPAMNPVVPGQGWAGTGFWLP